MILRSMLAAVALVIAAAPATAYASREREVRVEQTGFQSRKAKTEAWIQRKGAKTSNWLGRKKRKVESWFD